MRTSISVNICMSAWKRPKVSGLPTSDEKNTLPVTALISMPMPPCPSACLMTCCVFCRGALMPAWNSSLHARPSLVPMPSGHGF